MSSNDALLGFQMSILLRMDASYCEYVLNDIGISLDTAMHIRDACPFRIPQELGNEIDFYVSKIGEPVVSLPLTAVPENFANTIAHKFVLTLWPHLFWVVNARENSCSWGVGFQNQVNCSSFLDPKRMRIGLVSLSEIEKAADKCEPVDGWDEDVSYRIEIKGKSYEARFVLGLLQQWKELQ